MFMVAAEVILASNEAVRHHGMLYRFKYSSLIVVHKLCVVKFQYGDPVRLYSHCKRSNNIQARTFIYEPKWWGASRRAALLLSHQFTRSVRQCLYRALAVYTAPSDFSDDCSSSTEVATELLESATVLRTLSAIQSLKRRGRQQASKTH
jgi:hypothetical protein